MLLPNDYSHIDGFDLIRGTTTFIGQDLVQT